MAVHQYKGLAMPKKELDSRWPKWNRYCNHVSWRTGKTCKARALIGTDQCKRHGRHSRTPIGWKRYLLWVLLPETIRHTGVHTPVTDEEVEIVCNLIAQYVLAGDAHASEGVRMKALEFLFQSVAILEHPDPAILLTHLSREDADTAIKILRLNGLMK